MKERGKLQGATQQHKQTVCWASHPVLVTGAPPKLILSPGDLGLTWSQGINQFTKAVEMPHFLPDVTSDAGPAKCVHCMPCSRCPWHESNRVQTDTTLFHFSHCSCGNGKAGCSINTVLPGSNLSTNHPVIRPASPAAPVLLHVCPALSCEAALPLRKCDVIGHTCEGAVHIPMQTQARQ